MYCARVGVPPATWQQHRFIAIRIGTVLVGFLVVKHASNIIRIVLDKTAELAARFGSRMIGFFVNARTQVQAWQQERSTEADKEREFKQLQLQWEVDQLEAKRDQLSREISALEQKQAECVEKPDEQVAAKHSEQKIPAVESRVSRCVETASSSQDQKRKCIPEVVPRPEAPASVVRAAQSAGAVAPASASADSQNKQTGKSVATSSDVPAAGEMDWETTDAKAILAASPAASSSTEHAEKPARRSMSTRSSPSGQIELSAVKETPYSTAAKAQARSKGISSADQPAAKARVAGPETTQQERPALHPFFESILAASYTPDLGSYGSFHPEEDASRQEEESRKEPASRKAEESLREEKAQRQKYLEWQYERLSQQQDAQSSSRFGTRALRPARGDTAWQTSGPQGSHTSTGREKLFPYTESSEELQQARHEFRQRGRDRLRQLARLRRSAQRQAAEARQRAQALAEPFDTQASSAHQQQSSIPSVHPTHHSYDPSSYYFSYGDQQPHQTFHTKASESTVHPWTEHQSASPSQPVESYSHVRFVGLRDQYDDYDPDEYGNVLGRWSSSGEEVVKGQGDGEVSWASSYKESDEDDDDDDDV
ncbi:hypothetical protein Slin15195_G051060 [Septoria linicola]|uniref:Uncharacterized protein n=1 Tax=Septoria linicola TaxID=215465 RepID=A0A9Q9ALS5_9PEZI|nr:hypothetical protein Slin15195_G051060 [Septoria linicola]